MQNLTKGYLGVRFSKRLASRRLHITAIALLTVFGTIIAMHAPAAWAATTPGSLTGVSCTSAVETAVKFCTAVDANGYAWQFDNVGGTPDWDNGTQINASGGLAGISCYGQGFCMTISGADAWWYKGLGVWSAQGAVDSGNSLTGISCVTGSFCIAVDSSGDGAKWTSNNNGTWTSISPDSGNDFTAVSCASTTVCMAVESGGGYAYYNGSTWATGSVNSSNPDLMSVSCTAADFCMAGDSTGHVWRWTGPGSGKKWKSTSTTLQSGDAVNGISCGSNSFCEAVQSGGYAGHYDSGTWSTTQIETSNLKAVACLASQDSCMAVDVNGDGMMYNGTESTRGWNTTDVGVAEDSDNFVSVSCPSNEGFCAAVDTQWGNAYVESTTLWDWSGNQLGSSSDAMAGVSCTSTNFCMAVDVNGNVYTWSSSGGWTSGTTEDSYGGVTGISCASSNFCVIVDNSGHAVVDSSGSWNTYNADSSGAKDLTSVSCYNSSFCVTVDTSGDYESWGGSSWTSAKATAYSHDLVSISCPTGSFCEVVDSSNDAQKLNVSGTTYMWTSQGTADSTSNALTSVSCSSTTFCAAVDVGGNVATDNSGTWGVAATGDTLELESISCPTANVCAIGDSGGNVLTEDTSQDWMPSPVQIGQ